MNTCEFLREANAIADQLRGKGPTPAVRRRGAAKGPSARNLEVLAFMREFFSANDQLPPVTAICAHFGWAGNAAHAHLVALARFGLIEKNTVGRWRFARRPGAVGCSSDPLPTTQL